MDELIAHYGDIKRNNFNRKLINIKERCPITEYNK